MPDYPKHNNFDRALKADCAVGFHAGSHPESIKNEVVCLLANLRHLCDREGLDFQTLDRHAHESYGGHIEKHGILTTATSLYEAKASI